MTGAEGFWRLMRGLIHVGTGELGWDHNGAGFESQARKPQPAEVHQSCALDVSYRPARGRERRPRAEQQEAAGGEVRCKGGAATGLGP